VQALAASLPAGTPRLEEIAVNARVLLFTAVVAVGTGVLFGVAPALRAARTRLVASMQEGVRTAGPSRARRGFTSALAASEIALAVVLVTAAALLLQSFWRLRAVDPGFAAERVLTVRVNLPVARYGDAAGQHAFYEELVARADALPEVARAAVASQVPFDGAEQSIAMWIDGFTTDPNALTMVGSRSVTPAYFDALGVPLLEGRAFTAADRAGAVPVAIVDRSMAEQYWPDGRALGGRIRYPWGGDWITVVGVAADARDESLGDAHVPSFHVPFAQRPFPDAALVLATDRAPGIVLPRVATAVTGIDPSVPVSDARTLEDRLAGSVAGPRFTASLLFGFAAIALILGAIGIYGVISYSVGQRLREFGVRMALGASRLAVVRQVVGHGALVAGAGIGAGLLIAFAATRLLRGLLFGIAPDDARTFLVVPLLLGCVALLACWLPARRAASVAPSVALRNE
jgi:putative ABC transport system permease protein